MSDPIEPTLSSCGCCDDGLTEPDHPNPPGLAAIAYRIGTHPDFLARMTARLHAWEVLTCAGCEARFVGPDRLADVLDHIAKAHPAASNPADLVIAERPLADLGTRAPDDPAIALLDAWAVVGDVLTFYQERFANEHYLRTATERRSILELARAIGYELDPGVAAETYVAFTVDDAEGAPAEAAVPAGTQLMSIPAGGDERPQTFETADALTAHVRWNAVRPRLQHPLTLTASLRYLYLSGTATGLKAGHRLLLLVGGIPTVKRIATVASDPDANHTRVDFDTGTVAPSSTLPALPMGTLDPNQAVLPLTRANVAAQVVGKTWEETELQAFLTQHDWDTGTVLGYVDDLRAATFEDDAQQVLALRERLAFFGHNAPYYDSLPDRDDSDGSESFAMRALRIEDAEADISLNPGMATPGKVLGRVKSKTWPKDWDALGLSIWKDSLTNTYYYDTAKSAYADVYLERTVDGLAAGTWAVFERPPGTTVAYQIDAVLEGSRTGFGLSAKTAGLRLADASGDPLANTTTDKPEAFHFRRSTAHVKSEALALAPLPLTDDLVAGTTEIRLGTMVLGLTKGQVVALRGEEVGADGAMRNELLRLDAITHSHGTTVLTFEDGLTRSYVRDTVTLNANVVLASHGETVRGEVLGSGNGAAKHQRFTLKKPPLTHRAAVGGSESELTVRVDGVAWEQEDTLYGLNGTARAFLVRIDDDANATVVFGDGKSGARLPTGAENVTATYRSGIGSDGEVEAGTITLLKTRPYGIRSVTNPLAASGADDPETLADARTNAPLTVLTLDRIVSLQDYEDYARAYPGIGKARATAVWNGTGEVVHLTVADADGDAVVEPLYGRLLASIEAARDPLRPVVLDTFQPYVFFVTAKVLIDGAYLWETVKADVEKALMDAFSFTARGFAQPVSAAEVLQVMHGVDGVEAVDLDEFYKTAPDAVPSGSLFNSLLLAHPARYDKGSGTIRPAELLLIHTLGITLSQMNG